MSELHELVRRIEIRYSKDTETAGQTEPLEAVLQGQAIELWSDAAGRLFLVSDEADVDRLMRSDAIKRGEVYDAAEVRRIATVGDAATVAEIHQWKKVFDGVVRGTNEKADA